MSVARCQREVSASEFVEWQAFDGMEPGEPYRGDRRTATIAYTIYTMLVGKQGRSLKFSDFMPRDIEHEPQPQTTAQAKPAWQDIQAKLLQATLHLRRKRGKKSKV